MCHSMHGVELHFVHWLAACKRRWSVQGVCCFLVAPQVVFQDLQLQDDIVSIWIVCLHLINNW